MANIVIKDLQENVELDRRAMLAIAGGARLRAAGAGAPLPAPRKLRLFDLSPAGSAGPAAARPPR